MSTGSEQFYVRVAGRVTGPFTVARLREMKRIGRLPAFCELSRDRQKWVPAAEIFDEPQGRASVSVAASEPQPTAASGPPSGEQWYYSDPRGERVGPVPRSSVVALSSSAEVEEGTLVWKDGMEDWQPYYSVFPRRVVKGQHKVAEVGALLMMIAGWLWVTALTTMTLTLVLSLGREKMISLTFFIPGILGLANLILLVVGKSMLLTAPAGHGVRGSLITALAFSVVHVFLLTFVLTDFSDPVPTRLGSQSGLTATSWIPIVSTLPFASLTGTTMIYEKSVTNTLVLLLLLGWLEIGRLVSTLFAMRALSMTCRSHSGVMMSLSTLIVLAAVVFVTNLALISVAQHIQTTILDQNFDADISMRKIILWAFFSVYGLSIVIAMLYGLSVTFTYSAMKKAKL